MDGPAVYDRRRYDLTRALSVQRLPRCSSAEQLIVQRHLRCLYGLVDIFQITWIIDLV